MTTIEELERRINKLEKDLQEEKELTNATLSKANKAADYAQHAYRVDHYGIIWVWNTEQQKYCKTEMRVMSPKVANRSIESRHIADNAIEGRHLADNVIEGRMIKLKTIDGRSLKDDIIGPELIENNSIHGDSYQAGALIPGKLADDAVQTRNIKDRNVTALKIAEKNIFLEHLAPEVLATLKQDLQNQIDALEIAGVAVSNEFGTDKHISVSQKTLTDAIKEIWEKIEDMTGETLQGINMVVTPTFFVSEDGCDVHISANTVKTNGIFEKIQFFVDNELIFEDTFTEYVSFDHHLDIKPEYDYVIMCKAKIMGIEYPRQQIITRYNEFYIGAGSTYADIMDSAHARQLNGTMRHNYDVTFAEGNKLIIVMGAALRDGFIRADLNGVEIQMEEQTVTIDGKQYVVLTSDPWSAGDYNIDING